MSFRHLLHPPFFDPERVLAGTVEMRRIVDLRVGMGARVPWGGYVASN
jgi:hypothetical protein